MFIMEKLFTKENIIYGLILVFIFVLFKLVILNAYIPSESMENTMKKGDRLIGYRLTKEYKRGDIAIFRYDEKEYYIKRVIGVGGDVVVIKNNEVYVNGEKIDEPYVKEAWESPDKEYKVPKGEYFFLGDNRNESADSRFWDYPYKKEKDMIAKAGFRYWPLNKIGFVK